MARAAGATVHGGLTTDRREVRDGGKRFEFPTKKAAEQYLSDTKVRAGRGEYVDLAKSQLSKSGEEWLSEKLGRHPSTVGSWRVHIQHLSALEPLRLDKINVATIEKVRDQFARCRASASS